MIAADPHPSRITGVFEDPAGNMPIETYAYLGLTAPVETRIRLANSDDMLHAVGSAGNYWALDAFGRVIRDEWHLNAVGSTPLTKFEYGYDHAGNLLYARDEVNNGAGGSELFHNDGADPNTAYDRLNKRYRYARGTLSADNRSITTGGLDQPWRTGAAGTNERADHAPLNLGRPSFQGDFTAAQLLATIQAWQGLDFGRRRHPRHHAHRRLRPLGPGHPDPDLVHRLRRRRRSRQRDRKPIARLPLRRPGPPY